MLIDRQKKQKLSMLDINCCNYLVQDQERWIDGIDHHQSNTLVAEHDCGIQLYNDFLSFLLITL